MGFLIGWCWFAAAVLIVSLLVHLSTFLGIDPLAKWPGVMFIHLAIFPPFIAAIYSANRTGGNDSGAQDLAEHVGRLVEVRRRENSPGSPA